MTTGTVIFLDLDGTLMRNPFHSAVFPVVSAQLSKKTGRPAAEILDLVRDENLARRADRSVPPALAWDWDDIVQTVAGRLGVAFEGNLAELVAAHAGPPDSAALDDAPGVLRRLAGPGERGTPPRRLVAASLGLSKYQLPVLEALGLRRWLAGVLTPDLTGASKQERRFYGHWPDAASLCLMVGDLYEDDVVPAHGFGFRTAWKVSAAPGLETLDPFERPAAYPFGPEASVRPEAIIVSLAELPAVVERLEGAINET